MARTTNLTDFLTDVAGAIRTKKGSEEPIAAADFDTEIENLPSGGGVDLNEYFNNEITETPSTSGGIVLVKKWPNMVVDNNVTSLAYLFYDYTANQDSIPKVVCGSNVTDMRYMYGKSSANAAANPLRTIDLSGLDDTNVESIGHMFDCRTSLTNLDLSNFKGTALSGSNFSLNSVFANCMNLKKIDLSNLTPPSGMDCRNMFNKCYLVEEIDLDKWDIANTIASGRFSGMFSFCGNQLESGTYTKIYVKDQAAQNWVLTTSNGHPSTWSTDNIIIAGSEADLRNA